MEAGNEKNFSPEMMEIRGAVNDRHWSQISCFEAQINVKLTSINWNIVWKDCEEMFEFKGVFKSLLETFVFPRFHFFSN